MLLCASQLAVMLDGSVVAVARPALGADLEATGPDLAWVVNAYLVPFGDLVLLAGRLGDLSGPPRGLLAGLSPFTAASVACGLAPTLGMLVAARFAQGVGGALASAVVLGMIVRLFPNDRDRARALGAFGFVGRRGCPTSGGMPAPPALVNGLILDVTCVRGFSIRAAQRLPLRMTGQRAVDRQPLRPGKGSPTPQCRRAERWCPRGPS